MTTIKTSFFLLIAWLGSNLTLAANPNTDPEQDTIILKFGNNSHIIIYISDKEDLEELTRYDINKILADLNMEVKTQGDSVEVIEIKDEQGDRYLKDTTVVIYRIKTPEENDTELYDNNYEGEKNESKRTYYYYRGPDFTFDVGLNNYLENGRFPASTQPYALMPQGSWYWNLGGIYNARIAGPVFLNMGLTGAFNVYRFDNPRTRLISDDNGVRFVTDTAVNNPLKSKLADAYLMLRAVPMFVFSAKRKASGYWHSKSPGFRIGAGMYMGYRVWSRTKFKYDDGGKQKRLKTANYSLNDIRYGIRGQIGFRDIDLFVEYDLNDMFQTNQGAPALQRLQFGISF